LKLLQLAALAALRATRRTPQVFEQGCADVDEHARHIEELRQKLRDIYVKAASVLDYERDVQFANGMATFALSNGAVHIGSGRNDGPAVERLVQWLVANRAHEEA
jgi:hypothetical protein